MKLLKYFFSLITLSLIAYSGCWFYITNKMVQEINNLYAQKSYSIDGFNGSEHKIKFDHVASNGFPFKIGMTLEGLYEETSSSEITYKSPVHVGYNIISQKAYVQYDGTIEAFYKPVINKFGSELQINNFFFTIDIPFTKSLFQTLKAMEDPFEIVNHFGMAKIGSGGVKIYNLFDKKLFHEKYYEQLNVKFEHSKWYKSVKDLKENIPEQYYFEYAVKTGDAKQNGSMIPVSLLYGFYILPSDFDGVGNVTLNTSAKRFEDIGKDVDLKVNFSFKSKHLDLKSYKLDYIANINNKQPVFKIDSDAKIFIKHGAFDELFSYYKFLRPNLIKNEYGRLINNEVEYIINNKDVFNFTKLEDSNYHLNLIGHGVNTDYETNFSLENFSIFSDSSGFRIKHDSSMRRVKPKKWEARGILYIDNYPSVVEFTAGYIYRFGKFRFLTDEARKIYVDVNKSFLHSISDYPDSNSDDLSFEYEINSDNLDKTKIGSVRFDQIVELYNTQLFKKLLGKVGIDGDIIGKMKKIIPDIDDNSELIKKILPQIDKLDKNLKAKDIKENIKEKIENSISKDANDIVENIAPALKGNKIDKNLWKNLIK